MIKKLVSLLCIFVGLLTVSCSNYVDGIPKVTYPKEALGEANAHIALTELASGDTDKAQQDLELALIQAPRNIFVLDATGYYYEQTGQLDTANDYFFAAVLYAPQSLAALNSYGGFLCRNGAHRPGIIYFRKALALAEGPAAKKAEADIALCEKSMKEAQLALGANSMYTYHMEEKGKDDHGRGNNRTQ